MLLTRMNIHLQLKCAHDDAQSLSLHLPHVREESQLSSSVVASSKVTIPSSIPLAFSLETPSSTHSTQSLRVMKIQCTQRLNPTQEFVVVREGLLRECLRLRVVCCFPNSE